LGQRGPLGEPAINYLVNKYAYQAQLEDCTSHTLRHTFGKNLVDAGTPLDQVATLLGHESLETKVYTSMKQRRHFKTKEERERAHELWGEEIRQKAVQVIHYPTFPSVCFVDVLVHCQSLAHFSPSRVMLQSSESSSLQCVEPQGRGFRDLRHSAALPGRVGHLRPVIPGPLENLCQVKTKGRHHSLGTALLFPLRLTTVLDGPKAKPSWDQGGCGFSIREDRLEPYVK